jgi:glycerol-3-phosphate dehydrogenase
MLTNPYLRTRQIAQIATTDTWDLLVIGGGASGLGVALDAVSRGFKVLLLERKDFTQGTSSRSTKLIHGGVRYMAQGNFFLVMEALKERGILAKNASHLFKNQTFIIPSFSWWEGFYYLTGMKLYDLLAGKLKLGNSKRISSDQVRQRLPSLKPAGLYGGVTYQDGQFDDSRLGINLIQTIIDYGGSAVNYFPVTDFLKDADGKIAGVVAQDSLSGFSYEIKSKVVVNATGVFADEILQMDRPGSASTIRPSQGIHLVLDRSFLDTDDAVLIPKTDDGRVLFLVPWHGKVIAGTTDTPVTDYSFEPVALEEEIEFILQTVQKYLVRPPSRADVLSVFAGLRPLAAQKEGSDKTKEISRSHKIQVSDSGLFSLLGGKWTTFRKMGEDTVNAVIASHRLPPRPSTSEKIAVHGSVQPHKRPLKIDYNPLYFYGADLPYLYELTTENVSRLDLLDDTLPFIKAQVIMAVRREMALTVEDVLARRFRALFLDAEAACRMAPEVARLMAEELGEDEDWQARQVREFQELAKGYLPGRHHPGSSPAVTT